MLDGAALDFINHSKGLFIENGELVLSELFRKYPTEFGRDKASQLSTIKNYIVPGTLKKINPKMPVRYQFDWSLNDGTGMLGKKPQHICVQVIVYCVNLLWSTPKPTFESKLGE